jgi:hypothetical protein
MEKVYRLPVYYYTGTFATLGHWPFCHGQPDIQILRRLKIWPGDSRYRSDTPESPSKIT